MKENPRKLFGTVGLLVGYALLMLAPNPNPTPTPTPTPTPAISPALASKPVPTRVERAHAVSSPADRINPTIYPAAHPTARATR